MCYLSRLTAQSGPFSLEDLQDRLQGQLSPFHLTLFKGFLHVPQRRFGVHPPKVLLHHFLRLF